MNTYNICQKIYAPWHKKYGKLASLPIPKGLGESLLINFIIGLLLLKLYRRKFNSILITINYYIKMTHYLPIIIIVNIEELADLFIENILTKYGILKSIISDRGSLFTS